MLEIKEFCEKIDYKKPDIFEKCKHDHLISEKAEKISDLTARELEIY